jgi:hypothetical protein
VSQYIQILSDIFHTSGWLSLPGEKSKKLMLNIAYIWYEHCKKNPKEPCHTDTKVAGRNVMVINATVIMAALSLVAAFPMTTIILLSRWIITLYA